MNSGENYDYYMLLLELVRKMRIKSGHKNVKRERKLKRLKNSKKKYCLRKRSHSISPHRELTRK